MLKEGWRRALRRETTITSLINTAAGVPPEEVAVSEDDYVDLLRVSTLRDVSAVGKLYQANAAPKAVVTDRIRALALKLTTGLTEEREKARTLYHWVSKNIRYVAVILGSGGYVHTRPTRCSLMSMGIARITLYY